MIEREKKRWRRRCCETRRCYKAPRRPDVSSWLSPWPGVWCHRTEMQRKLIIARSIIIAIIIVLRAKFLTCTVLTVLMTVLKVRNVLKASTVVISRPFSREQWHGTFCRLSWIFRVHVSASYYVSSRRATRGAHTCVGALITIPSVDWNISLAREIFNWALVGIARSLTHVSPIEPCSRECQCHVWVFSVHDGAARTAEHRTPGCERRQRRTFRGTTDHFSCTSDSNGQMLRKYPSWNLGWHSLVNC